MVTSLARLSAISGIGFMLVGALAYGVPLEQVPFRLIPAFAGMAIAIGGVVCLTHVKEARGMLLSNIVGSLLLLVYGLASLYFNWRGSARELLLKADSAVVFLSALLAYVSFMTLRLKKVPPRDPPPPRYNFE